MAASANPVGNDDNSSRGVAVPPPPSSSNGNTTVADNSGSQQTQAALKHHHGIAVEWTPDEQALLEELLVKFAPESNIVRYAKIAMQLKEKSVRDVALRCRWMTKKENGKRRKEEHSAARRNKEKKEKGGDSLSKPLSHPARPSGIPYVPPLIAMDNDDGISYKAIGGVTGQLLEQNAQTFNQISANFAAFQIHDNINLFCQTRDNFLNILNNLNDIPEIMNQMPPLPVKINEDLANSILPRSSHQVK